MRYTVSAPASLHAAIQLPASKSISNRALILHSLAHGNILPRNLSDCDDTIVMTRALDGNPGHIDILAAGTAMRFLTAYLSVTPGTRIITGTQRMQQRPIRILVDALRELGARIEYVGNEGFPPLRITGTELTGSEISLAGNVSSQYISGLLFALPLLPDGSRLVVEGARESASYLQLTLRALATFGLTPREQEEGWTIASQGYASPGAVQVEGDWSNAAPWLCLGMLGGEGVTVTGMDLDSLQGDRAVCRVLAAMGGQVRTAADRVTVRPGPRVPTRMDARDIPDLVPVLAAVAAATPGVTEITGAARLRLKESDRLETTARMLSGLGGQVEETADGLLIRGRSHLSGGQVDAAGDHRIAMAAAVASGACTGPVTITGAQAVEKSYPTFWAELRSLGKQVEETPVGP